MKRKITTRQREDHYRRQFGIGVEDYEILLDKQAGVCAVCKNAETSRGRAGAVKRLAVDHCHATGTIRGLLCDACNGMLAKARDNKDTLRAAALYLEVADTGYRVRPGFRFADSLTSADLDEMERLLK